MPVYEAQCENCGEYKDYYQTVENYLVTPECCGSSMKKVIRRAPAGFGDLPGYQSPATGKWIDGRKAREEDLKRSGCRPWEGMEVERKEAQKKRQEDQAVYDAKLTKAAEKAVAQASPETKRVLGLQ